MVRMLNPSNLHIAFGLAKMQEENVATLKRIAKLGSVPTRSTMVLQTHMKNGPLFQSRDYHQAK